MLDSLMADDIQDHDSNTIGPELAGYIKPVIPEEIQDAMKAAYREAKGRLNNLPKKREGDDKDIPIPDYVLEKVYSVPKEDLSNLTDQDRLELSRVKIIDDLATTTFFKPDGSPSSFNRRIAGHYGLEFIDIVNYQANPKRWVALSQSLNDLAPKNYDDMSPSHDDEYSGNLKLNSKEPKDRAQTSSDALERYVSKFPGEYPVAIAIPYTLKYDDYSGVEIVDRSDEFKEPTGGDQCDRLLLSLR